MPCALTVAGSDSGGGAGIQADLKTFAALRVHGCTALTCVTAQNPRGVRGIQPCTPAIVRQQIEAVFAELRPTAVKTGMLFSAEIISAVAEALKHQRVPMVVDPVMMATSGAQLLKPAAVKVLQSRLFPLATLLTPNLDETALLLGRRLRSVDDLRAAARELHARFGTAALVKGGHLRSQPDAVDVFFDGRTESLLRAPFVRGVSTHGTGCTYSAAIAAELARGRPLPAAVRNAKRFITRAIARSAQVSRHTVLTWFAAP
jgi:hydroxymethylpyrimidine/phosphomethylpyrimidine kinase